jgi:hypothetical protein
MNAKKNNDLPDDGQFDDTFDEHNAELNDELGNLNDDQFEDYDLNNTEETPAGDVTDENAAAADELATLNNDEMPETVTSGKKGIVDLIKENWLFIIIGVVVVGIAGYMIYGVLNPSAPPPASSQQTQGSFSLPQQQATQQQPSAQQTTEQTTLTTSSSMPVGGTSIVMSEAGMKTLMQGFQQMVQENSQNIQQSLQTIINNTNGAAINSMQQEFSSLGKEIKTYSNSIATLNKRLDTLQGQLSILVAQQTAQQEKLSLRAVVPGRAWLVDGKGRTISVTEGTTLGNFGMITNINSNTGEVTTSSGYIFH